MPARTRDTEKDQCASGRVARALAASAGEAVARINLTRVLVQDQVDALWLYTWLYTEISGPSRKRTSPSGSSGG